MDGLARVAGVLSQTITIADRVITLTTPRLSDLAALERELVREKIQDYLLAAAHAARSVPREQLDSYWSCVHREASRQSVVTVREAMTEWLLKSGSSVTTVGDGIEQIVWTLYLCTRRHHSGDWPTLADMRAFVLDNVTNEKLQEVGAVVTYLVEGGLKNSGSPTGTSPP